MIVKTKMALNLFGNCKVTTLIIEKDVFPMIVHFPAFNFFDKFKFSRKQPNLNTFKPFFETFTRRQEFLFIEYRHIRVPDV